MHTSTHMSALHFGFLATDRALLFSLGFDKWKLGITWPPQGPLRRGLSVSLFGRQSKKESRPEQDIRRSLSAYSPYHEFWISEPASSDAQRGGFYESR